MVVELVEVCWSVLVYPKSHVECVEGGCLSDEERSAQNKNDALLSVAKT